MEHRLKAALLAAFGEEGLDDGGAVGGEDAGRDFDLMIQARVRKDFEAGTDGAPFGIVGAIDKARNAGLDDGAGAHAAGLDGYVQRSTSETVVAEEVGGLAKDDDFGVGSGVVVADGAITGAREDFAIVDEDCADGDFAGGRSGASFGESLLNVLDIRFHFRRENNMREGKRKN
jgi:hypothetical protein